MKTDDSANAALLMVIDLIGKDFPDIAYGQLKKDVANALNNAISDLRTKYTARDELKKIK